MILSKGEHIEIKRFPKQMEKFLFTVLLSFLVVNIGWGQLRTASVSGNWSNTATWGGASVPTSANDVVINNGINVTIDVATAECNSVTINGTNANTYITVGANSLVVTNAITINAPTTNNRNNYIAITSGSLTAASISMATTTADSRDCYVSIGTGTVNISGNITMASTLLRNHIDFTGAGSLYIQGDLTGGGLSQTAGTGSTVYINGSATQLIQPNAANGYSFYNLNIQNNGTVSLGQAITVRNLAIAGTATLDCGAFNVTGNAAGTFTMNAGTTLRLGNPAVATATTFPTNYTNVNIILDVASTVIYQANANQTVSGVPTYGNLTILPGNTAARTRTLGAATLITGDLTIEGATYTASLLPAGVNLTVNGTTNINAYGVFNDATLAGTNTFVGLVDIHANGSWAAGGNSPSVFQGGLNYDGSGFTSGTGIYTFNTNNQTISGSQSMSIANMSVTGISLTNTNTAGLTIATALSGTGTFINGDATHSAILNLSGTGNPLAITNKDFTSNPNTVEFNGTVAQTIAANNFYNLIISGARAATNVTFTNGATIGVANIFSPTATFSTGNYVTTGSTINFNGTSAQTIPALGATNYNNVTISGGSTKTLVGNVLIGTGATGVLNLNGGVLELDGFNLTIQNTSAINTAITGAFNSTNMIATNGTGYLRKNGATAAAFQGTYPVGSGGYYSPMIITSIAATLPTYLTVRAVPTALSPSYINKYWDVNANIALTDVTATFQYDPAELNGASSNVSFSPDWGSTWQNPPLSGSTSFGANSFTIDVNDGFRGYWTQGLRTFYSYQDGSWSNPTTWTSDPSGTLQLGSSVPSINDIVVILSGRTVTLPANVGDANIDLTINAGGYLNMDIYSFSLGLQALRGQGTLQLSSASFPTATINTFVNAGGGTTEYNAGVTLPVAQTTYNNLKINTSGTVVQMNDLTLNGNLVVSAGTFQINDNTTAARRQLTVNGNVDVESSGNIRVGQGVTNTTITPTGITTTLAGPYINYYFNQSHSVTINGDFTNNGSVRFTNLTFPVYNVFPPIALGSGTTGFATVYFRGAANNTLTCNGQTDFYNLVLDKGTDQSYSLTINADDYTHFRLYGANIAGGDAIAVLPANGTPSNPNIRKALWLRNGTMVLQGNIAIPSLAEGNDAGTAPYNQYIIPANAALVLDGVDVIVQSTADLYQEVNAAYTVAGGAGTVNGVIAGPNESGLLVMGKLQVNNGYFSTKESRGILYNATVAGQIIINGGTVDVKQFRTLNAGTGLVSYLQTGGNVILRGRFQRIPSAYTSASDLSAAPMNTVRINDAALDAAQGSFSINNTSDVFSMTGGYIKIYDVPAPGATSRAYDILTNSSNYNVTGGNIEFYPTTGTGGTADATPWIVSSNAPVYNMLINRVSGVSTIQLNAGYPLTASNNLTLQSGVFTANNLNVSVGGDFTIESGTTYTPGTNTTTFNGSGAQNFIINLVAPQTLNNFTVNKPAGSTLTLGGSQGLLTVNGALNITLGGLNDNGATVNVAGNVYNSGVHSGTGAIVLNGTNVQVIDGDGNGTFQNLTLNNNNAAAAPVSLNNDITINGNLTFSRDKLFNISTFNVKFNTTATVTGASTTRYIQTSGNLGDGGVTKVYSSAAAFVFPIGVVNYTPASIGLSIVPTAYGRITISPVNAVHPNVTSAGRSLTYYWHVVSSGFTLGAATVTHGYYYNDANVVTGAGITEGEYVAARFNTSNFTWTRGVATDVDETANIIGEPGSGGFLENVAFIDGDYTAGDDNPTNPFGTPTKYFSRQSGNWGTATNWSLTSHTGGPAATSPGANDIVIIGNGNTITFETPVNYLTNANTAPHSCASLQVETGATLDTRYNPSSVFSVVRTHPNGNGTIRVAFDWDSPSTLAFPGGDFTEFNQNLGTTDLYSTNANPGTEYYMPNGITSYGNLKLSPWGGSNIMFPNNNVIIYGDLVTTGQNADSWFCPTWDGNYPTAPAVRVAKTITIRGNLDIQGGALVWYGNGAITQNFVVYGNVTVGANSAIDVWSGATSQSLSIGGNLINNTVGTTAGGTTTPRRCDFSLLPVTFFGNTSSSITNTINNPLTIFDAVTVNKGTSQATTLTIDITGTLNTPTDNWLTLQNGTLRYQRTNPGSDFTISTTTPFNIPATAGLYINYPNNTGNRNILIGNANNTNGDLLLNGKLTVVAGRVFVGPTTAGGTTDNDVIYSGSGASAIDVQGGILTISGMVRRSGTSGGILSYNQSGGTVSVYGIRNTNTTNAGFEILNTGSVFNMSGNAVLNFYRGGSANAFGDIYIRPASSTVNGTSTINITRAGATAAEQTFKLDCSVPMNNLVVTGTGVAPGQAIVSLQTNPLIVKNNLTLTNANSILNTNNLDVTIGGDFSNAGALATTYNCGTNTTTFNGGAQSITVNVPTFNNLVVSSVTSLTTTANAYSINGNLSINTGSLILNNRLATLRGNLSVSGSYTDDNVNGGILLTNGSAQHQISGTGSFGRLVLNDNYGASVLNDVSFQNNLVLTLGKMNIGSNQLTLGLSSSLGGAPFTLNNYIVSDGVASSKGIRKFFPIILGTTNFYFPVGVSGKFTPLALTINRNDAVGYLNVTPVNNNHPAVLDASQVLKYYWQVESSGLTNFDGNMLYTYNPSDVMGDESNYIAARLLVPGTYWSKFSTNEVDETNHQITFAMPAGTNNLSGDFTAGVATAIPEEVPVYNSIVENGDWSDPATWEAVGTSPPCPAGGPNGFIVNINTTVRTDNNYCFAYKTTINNRLEVPSGTFGHNLGVVDGAGTLYVESANLPAGNYTTFLDCVLGGGTLEYGGAGNYTINATLYNTVPNLFFTGSGTRYLPNKDLTICNRMVIDGPTLDNTANNSALYIQGTMERYNAGVFRAGSGATATVIFEGSSAQSLGGALGNFVAPSGFNNLEINNPNGLTINGNTDINRNLLLTDGIITVTSPYYMTLINSSIAAVIPNGGSNSSFIDGIVRKNIVNGSSFLYPIGKGTTFGHPMTLTNSAGATYYWSARYNMPTSNLTGPYAGGLQSVNTDEYYSISVNSGTRAAKIKIGWDAYSALTPSMTPGGMADMRIAYYATPWTGQPSVTTGTDAVGDVETSGTVNITTTARDFTTGSINLTIARASLNPSGPVCGTSTGIPIKFSWYTSPVPLNYTLDYTIDGAPQTTENITTTSYTLATPTIGDYQLTGFTYNNGLTVGVADPTIVTVYALPTTSDAGPDQSLCGFTGATLAGNDPAPYSGLWTKISGIGGVISAPTSYNSGFSGTAGNTYTLRWTISNNSCKSSNDVVIAFPVAPQRPSNFTAAPANVCQGGSGYVYTVPAITGVTYNWSYSGTGATINGSGNSVTVDFSSLATNGNISVTATNGCGTSAARTTAVNVRARPTASVLTASDATICDGASSALQVSITGGASPYSVVIVNAGSTTGYISGADIAVTPASTTIYSITSVTDNNGCTSDGLSGTPTITVLPVLSHGTMDSGDETLCNGGDPSDITLSVLPSGSAGFDYQWYYQDGIIAAPSGSSTVGWTVISGETSDSYDPPSGLLADRTFALLVTPTGSPTCGSAAWSNGVRQVTVLPVVDYGTLVSADEAFCSPGDPSNIVFSVSPSGSASFDYLWYYQDGLVAAPSGSSTVGWTSIGGATTNSYNPPSGLTGSRTYAVYVTPSGSPTCGSSVWASGARQVTINLLPAITGDPSDVTINAGQNTSFTVAASGAGLTYQWEVNSGSGWNPLVNGGVYSNVDAATMNITAATLSMDGYQYRCEVSGTCTPAAVSNAALLTVNPTATVEISGSTTICAGETATLTLTLTGTADWSVSYNAGAVPQTIPSITTTTYTFDVSPAVTTVYTLTGVTDANGAGTIVAPGTVTVTVNPLPASGPLYRLPNQ